jgi:hypothetical protein
MKKARKPKRIEAQDPSKRILPWQGVQAPRDVGKQRISPLEQKRFDPDKFKAETGRCPPGYHSDDGGKCLKAAGFGIIAMIRGMAEAAKSRPRVKKQVQAKTLQKMRDTVAFLTIKPGPKGYSVQIQKPSILTPSSMWKTDPEVYKVLTEPFHSEGEAQEASQKVFKRSKVVD